MATVTTRPVSPTVPFGGGLLALGVVQFTAAMLVVQFEYPGYSDLANYISDLGNSTLSPWFAVFNASIVVLGACAIAGVLLAWSGFRAGPTRIVGLPLILLAGMGAVLVGLFPENVNLPVHDLASLLVFAPGGLGLVALSAGMRARTSWAWLRLPSAALGLVTLVSLAYYVPTQGNHTTWYPGLVERFIVVPILLWGLLVGAQLLRTRRNPRAFTPSREVG